jgi:hypothetical protein
MERIETAKKNIHKGLELIKELERLIEMWKPIEGYPNYAVSSFARVKNTKTGKIRKLRLKKDGYYEVLLPLNGKLKHFQVISCESFY